jgi:hypothetical protein
MGSRGERIVGLLGLGSVFLEVFYCGGSFYGCAVYRQLVLLYDIYLALMCARYMLALTSATRVCSHVCRAVSYLPAVCCFRPPGVGVCGHAVRVAFLLSHGPHAHFRVLTFLKRPTRSPRTPRRGCVATRFFFPDADADFRTDQHKLNFIYHKFDAELRKDLPQVQPMYTVQQYSQLLRECEESLRDAAREQDRRLGFQFQRYGGYNPTRG